MKKAARSFLVFTLGLFAMSAQPLLFREFVSSFESNDMAVSIFFGSWFLWIALTAWIITKWPKLAEKLSKNIEILLFAYIPAFILQMLLITHARELIGIEAYALFPLKSMLALSIPVNAPVSCVTGFLFPSACRQLEEDREIPVSSVYVLECLGSFIGGLGVTFLLFLTVNSIMIFFIMSFFVTLSIFFVRITRSPDLDASGGFPKAGRLTAVLLPIIFLLCIIGRLDREISNYMHILKWSKLLPLETFEGDFQTAQAEYLYGIYDDQWMAVREGSVCETIPDHESAGITAAVNLCQNPDAKKILIVGSGIGLCGELLRIPQINHITWAHYDSEYIQKIDNYIPENLKIRDKRLHRVAGDIRSYLKEKKNFYDIAILNLPDAVSSVLNRYFTIQFYHLVKNSMTENGILGVKISGGENVMGAELACLGASVKTTLGKVFSKLVIKPGEDTWFIASDSKSITGNPEILEKKFAGIKGASAIFPPKALFSIYLPDREAKAFKKYDSTDIADTFLTNYDSRPLVYLFGLLFASKQSGFTLTEFIQPFLLAGIWVFIFPVLVFLLLWISRIWLISDNKKDAGGIFESLFLIFTAGFVSISAVIVLMYLYQTRFGSLYLHVGLIASVFMAGLFVGGASARRFLLRNKMRSESLFFWIILSHVLILIVIAYLQLPHWEHSTFVSAFALLGICGGAYFPITADRLDKSGFQSGVAGSKLESSDHIGATMGAFTAGIVMVPALGTKNSLLFLSVLLFINIPLALPAIYRSKSAKRYSLMPVLLIVIFLLTVSAIKILRSFSSGIRRSAVSETVLTKESGQTVRLSSPEMDIKTISKADQNTASPKKVSVFPASETASHKKARDADMKRIRNMIKDNKLSDHEAEFYKKL